MVFVLLRRKMKKKILVFILSVVILILCNGCKYKGYFGEHSDLYTVATNSILWNNGHSFGAEREIDPEIEIIEQDRYGRTLFIYCEEYYSCFWNETALTFSTLLIAQRTSEEVVYYYEDYNYITLKQEMYTPRKEFAKEEIEYLKLLNDWDKALDLDKCISKSIVNNKPKIPEDALIFQVVREKLNVPLEKKLELDYLTSDAAGNFIIYGARETVLEGKFASDYFAAFVPSGNEIQEIEFFVPSDLCNYREEFIEFKKQNGWVS